MYFADEMKLKNSDNNNLQYKCRISKLPLVFNEDITYTILCNSSHRYSCCFSIVLITLYIYVSLFVRIQPEVTGKIYAISIYNVKFLFCNVQICHMFTWNSFYNRGIYSPSHPHSTLKWDVSMVVEKQTFWMLTCPVQDWAQVAFLGKWQCKSE